MSVPFIDINSLSDKEKYHFCSVLNEGNTKGSQSPYVDTSIPLNMFDRQGNRRYSNLGNAFRVLYSKGAGNSSNSCEYLCVSNTNCPINLNNYYNNINDEYLSDIYNYLPYLNEIKTYNEIFGNVDIVPSTFISGVSFIAIIVILFIAIKKGINYLKNRFYKL